MVIVQHYADSAKHYAEATPLPGSLFAVPDRCPHPDCRAPDALIRWGTYERQARTGLVSYRIRVQRVRCKACGRTHSLLPDFLHPYRHYEILLLQHVVCLYLLVGLGINRLMEHLPGRGPGRSTVREWITSFAYGAGNLLFDMLLRGVMKITPLAELPEGPPLDHLDRPLSPIKRHRLGRAHRFWQLAEHFYPRPRFGCLASTSGPINCSPSSSTGSRARGFHPASSGRRACSPPQRLSLAR